MQKATIEDALNHLALSGEIYRVLLNRANFELGVYRPVKVDLQRLHTRDELYIIMSGHGDFVLGLEQERVGQGDVLFVAAGTEHRFVDFSDDFSTWVLFFPE
jgi:mannose-6-phosphate isomerase-like protein (cupin superfamily)